MVSNGTVTAFNHVPNAKNEVHEDKVVRQYGFKGGLVPGATLSAYLVHPLKESTVYL